ncbi:MAG: tyrosine-type recombinase/integrase [Solirubrobacterales bacterium]
MATGIVKLHSRGCASKTGGRCNCNAGYQAWVFSNRDGKKIRKVFPSAAAAKSWRAEALSAVQRGGLRATGPIILQEAWEAWYAGAQAGTVTNRSGDRYKPSALRSYERAMRLRVLPKFRATRISELHRPDLQEFADGLLSDGLNPSTIKVTLLPLRAVLRRAVARGELVANPCDGLELAAVRSRRERIARPEEAERLIAAVPESDRAIWATAFYAGLRRGELQALRAECIDLGGGVISVERGWDEKEGEIKLKSRAGRRRVPIPAALRDFLLEQRLATPREGSELVFGRTPASPFYPKTLQERADAAWEGLNAEERAAAEEEDRDADLIDRVVLHDARHTFASLMIAAGVNVKAIQTFMGHSSVAITLDLYGHLMPGSEAEAAQLLDTYLDANRAAQAEQVRHATGQLTG